MEWVERAGDVHGLDQVDNGERGNVEVRSGGGGVGDFHNQRIRSNNVVMLSLEISTS